MLFCLESRQWALLEFIWEEFSWLLSCIFWSLACWNSAYENSLILLKYRSWRETLPSNSYRRIRSYISQICFSEKACLRLGNFMHCSTKVSFEYLSITGTFGLCKLVFRSISMTERCQTVSGCQFLICWLCWFYSKYTSSKMPMTLVIY